MVLACRISKPFNLSSYLLLPLVFERVGALIWHLLQCCNLFLFALADDLGFPQHTLNCGWAQTQNTHKEHSAPASGYEQMDTRIDVHTHTLELNWCAVRKSMTGKILFLLNSYHFFCVAKLYSRFVLKSIKHSEKTEKWEKKGRGTGEKKEIKILDWAAQLENVILHHSNPVWNCLFLGFLLWVAETWA